MKSDLMLLKTFVLMFVLAGGFTLSGWCNNPVSDSSTKPNIMLILVDDVGYVDVGAFSSYINKVPTDGLFVETPCIDKLAKECTMFTQFYACSVCAPTRASLLTGKMNNRMGMWDAYATVNTTFEKTGKPVPEGCHILDNEPWDEYNYSKTDRGVTIPVAATALHSVKTMPQGLTAPGTHFMTNREAYQTRLFEVDAESTLTIKYRLEVVP